MNRIDDAGLASPPVAAETSAEALITLHDADVRAALRRVLGRCRDEDDLVQEVFVRLVIRLRQPGELCVGAWLRGVARNLAVDELRRRRPVPVEDTQLEAVADCPAFDKLHADELYARMVQGARTLPARQRDALAASLSGDGTPGTAAVAARLGVSVHAAESLLSRARAGLRRQLAETGTERGSLRVSLAAAVGALLAAVAWLARRGRWVGASFALTASVTGTAWLAGTGPADGPSPTTVPAAGAPAAPATAGPGATGDDETTTTGADAGAEPGGEGEAAAVTGPHATDLPVVAPRRLELLTPLPAVPVPPVTLTEPQPPPALPPVEPGTVPAEAVPAGG